MTREEAIERFNGIINAMSISIAQAKFYPTKAELDELCDIAIEALQADAVSLTGTMKYLAKPHNYCEVVRCKNCKNGKYEFVDNKGWIYCKHHFDYWVADDFCSYGERGEE